VRPILIVLFAALFPGLEFGFLIAEFIFELLVFFEVFLAFDP
jgi:hypothetical protein